MGLLTPKLGNNIISSDPASPEAAAASDNMNAPKLGRRNYAPPTAQQAQAASRRLSGLQEEEEQDRELEKYSFGRDALKLLPTFFGQIKDAGVPGLRQSANVAAHAAVEEVLEFSPQNYLEDRFGSFGATGKTVARGLENVSLTSSPQLAGMALATKFFRGVGQGMTLAAAQKLGPESAADELAGLFDVKGPLGKAKGGKKLFDRDDKESTTMLWLNALSESFAEEAREAESIVAERTQARRASDPGLFGEPGEFFKDRPSMSRIALGMADSAPTMIGSLLLSLSRVKLNKAGVPDRTVNALINGLMATDTLREVGPIYLESREAGQDHATARDKAVLAALGTFVLDRLGFDALLSKSPVGKGIREALGDKTAAGLVSILAKGSIEGGTEILQEAWQFAISNDYKKGIKDFFREVDALEVFIIGKAMGTGMAAVESGIQKMADTEGNASLENIVSQEAVNNLGEADPDIPVGDAQLLRQIEEASTEGTAYNLTGPIADRVLNFINAREAMLVERGNDPDLTQEEADAIAKELLFIRENKGINIGAIYDAYFDRSPPDLPTQAQPAELGSSEQASKTLEGILDREEAKKKEKVLVDDDGTPLAVEQSGADFEAQAVAESEAQLVQDQEKAAAEAKAELEGILDREEAKKKGKVLVDSEGVPQAVLDERAEAKSKEDGTKDFNDGVTLAEATAKARELKKESGTKASNAYLKAYNIARRAKRKAPVKQPSDIPVKDEGAQRQPKPHKSAKKEAHFQKTEADIKKMSARSGVEVLTMRRFDDLPAEIRRRIEDTQPQEAAELRAGEIPGFYDPATDKTYMFPEAISSTAEAARVLTHELVGHAGMYRLFGRVGTEQERKDLRKKYKSLLKEVFGKKRAEELLNMDGTKAMQAVLTDVLGTKAGAKAAAEVAETYGGLFPLDMRVDANGVPVNQKQFLLGVEEMFAALSETRRKDPSTYKRFVAAIKRILRDLGIDYKFTDNDIDMLLSISRQAAQEKLSGKQDPESVRFSRRAKIDSNIERALGELKQDKFDASFLYSETKKEKLVKVIGPDGKPVLDADGKPVKEVQEITQVGGWLNKQKGAMAEAKWTGLLDMLKIRKKWTKKQLEDFINAHKFEVRQTTFTDQTIEGSLTKTDAEGMMLLGNTANKALLREGNEAQMSGIMESQNIRVVETVDASANEQISKDIKDFLMSEGEGQFYMYQESSQFELFMEDRERAQEDIPGYFDDFDFMLSENLYDEFVAWLDSQNLVESTDPSDVMDALYEDLQVYAPDDLFGDPFSQALEDPSYEVSLEQNKYTQKELATYFAAIDDDYYGTGELNFKFDTEEEAYNAAARFAAAKHIEGLSAQERYDLIPEEDKKERPKLQEVLESFTDPVARHFAADYPGIEFVPTSLTERSAAKYGFVSLSDSDYREYTLQLSNSYAEHRKYVVRELLSEAEAAGEPDLVDQYQQELHRLNKLILEGGADFTDAHDPFDQDANVFVHVRAGEFFVGGKRVLVINEIQSDWAGKIRSKEKRFGKGAVEAAQEGRVPDGVELRSESFEDTYGELRKQYKYVSKSLDPDTGGPAYTQDGWYWTPEAAANSLFLDVLDGASAPLPFRQVYLQMALKQIVHEAAAWGKYDYVAWAGNNFTTAYIEGWQRAGYYEGPLGDATNHELLTPYVMGDNGQLMPATTVQSQRLPGDKYGEREKWVANLKEKHKTEGDSPIVWISNREAIYSTYSQAIPQMLGKYVKQWGASVVPDLGAEVEGLADLLDKTVQKKIGEKDYFAGQEETEALTKLRETLSQPGLTKLAAIPITPEMVASAKEAPPTMFSKPRKQPGEGQDRHRASDRFRKDPFLTPRIVEAITDRFYDVVPNRKTRNQVIRLVDKRGFEEATALFNNPKSELPGAQRIALGIFLLRAHNALALEARSKAYEKIALTHEDKAIELAEKLDQYGLEAGQTVQAFRMYGETISSPELARKLYIKSLRRAHEKELQQQQSRIENVQEVAKEAVEAAKRDAFNDVSVRKRVNKIIGQYAQKAIGSVRAELKKREGLAAEIAQGRAKRKRKVDPGSIKFAKEPKEMSQQDKIEAAADYGVDAFFQMNGPTKKQWVEHMTQTFGDNIKPFINDIWFRTSMKADRVMSAYLSKAAQIEAEGGEEKIDTQKLVKEMLEEEDLSLQDLILQSLSEQDATIDNLSQKLASKLNLSQAEVAPLVLEFKEAYNKMAGGAREAALRQRLKNELEGPGAPKQKARKSIAQKIIELVNLGALNEEEVRNAFVEHIKLPTVDPEVMREIEAQAVAIQKLPEGSLQRMEATQGLMSYIATQKGVKPTEIMWALWYARILSGPQTHARNIISTATNTVGEVVSYSKTPGQLAAGILGALKGVPHGSREFWQSVRTGKALLRSGMKYDDYGPVLELDRGRKSLIPKIGEKAGQIGWLIDHWKMVQRLLIGEDVFFYTMAEEARRYQLAYEAAKIAQTTQGASFKAEFEKLLANDQIPAFAAQASQEGLSGRQAKRRVRQLTVQNSDERINDPRAGITPTEFAENATFTNPPQGHMGVLANHIAVLNRDLPPNRFIVPFTNVVANVHNMSTDYTPWGFVRTGIRKETAGVAGGAVTGMLLGGPLGAAAGAAAGGLAGAGWAKTGQSATTGGIRQIGGGFRFPEGDEARARKAKAMFGSTLLMAMYVMDAMNEDEEEPWFQITANGPSNRQKMFQLRAQGWKPYSIRIGNTYISYQYTPMLVPFAMVGRARDAARYEDWSEQDWSARTGLMLLASAQTVADMSFLTGVAGLFEILSRQSAVESSAKMVEKFIGNYAKGVAYSNLVTFAFKVWDDTLYDANTIAGVVMRNTPGINAMMEKPRVNLLGEQIELLKGGPVYGDFISRQSKDPVWNFLGRKQVFIPGMSDITLPGGEAASEDFMYEYAKLAGQNLRKWLEARLENGAIENLSSEEIQSILEDKTREIRAEAKKSLREKGLE